MFKVDQLGKIYESIKENSLLESKYPESEIVEVKPLLVKKIGKLLSKEVDGFNKTWTWAGMKPEEGITIRAIDKDTLNKIKSKIKSAEEKL